MSHTCSSTLIRCMDFRFTSSIDAWMKEQGIMDDCDVISIAGVSKAIAENPKSQEAQFILSQIRLSKELHSSKTLYLIHHTDCGAYGGHQAFENINTEKEKYMHDMIVAGKIIADNFPELKVVHVLANIEDSKQISFSIIT